MATQSGANEDYRLLEDFVCDAIPDQSVFASCSGSRAPSRGVNEGTQLCEEAALDSPAKSHDLTGSSNAGSGQQDHQASLSPELESLTNQQLTAFVTTNLHQLTELDLQTIYRIARERLARCEADVARAAEEISHVSKLIQACGRAG